MIVGVKTKNGSYDHDHAPLWGGCPKIRHDIVYLCTKFGDFSFSHSRDITGAHKKFKMSNVILITPFLKVICHPHAMLGLDTAYQYIKSDNSSLSVSEIWSVPTKIQMVHVT